MRLRRERAQRLAASLARSAHSVPSRKRVGLGFLAPPGARRHNLPIYSPQRLTLCKVRSVDDVRITEAVAQVLRVFLDDAANPRYGYELMRLTGYPSGKLYPLLARLLSAGWLVKEHEQVDPAHEGRPARRFYRLTPDGAVAARQKLANGQRLSYPSHAPRLRPAVGQA